MTLTDSFPTEDAGGLSIDDTRLILAGDVVRSVAGVPRLGVLPAHTSPLVTGTAGMAYDVAAFNAVTSRNGTGVEKVTNGGPVSVGTTAAPSSNSRIDVIWVRCRFDLYGDGGVYTPLFGVTQGAPNLTPAKPAIPAGALELATAVVTSTDVATSTTVITQTHLYTAATGGTVLLRNKTEADAWTPGSGGRAYRLDQGWSQTFDGNGWRVAPGTVLASAVSTSSNGLSTAASAPVKTPVLPIGQKVKIQGRTALSGAAAGATIIVLRWLNTGADVASGTGSSKVARVTAPAGSSVVTVPAVEAFFTTTAAAEISAALFPSTNAVLYGADEITVEIVAV